MKQFLSEFIGTFILVFVGTGAIVIDQQRGEKITHLGISIVFGLIVTALIYSFGPLSGCHINPAVSIILAILNKSSVNQLLLYIIAQISGAISASYLLKIMFPQDKNLGATQPSGSTIQSFTMEVIISFVLMFVIIQVSNNQSLNPLSGIIIGNTVCLLALFAGPVCGASMNPARSIGPAIASKNFKHLWVYLIAPVFGMALATLFYSTINQSL